MEYPEFTKNFYEEHEEISNMTPDQMIELRKKLGINVQSLLHFLHSVILFDAYWMHLY